MSKARVRAPAPPRRPSADRGREVEGPVLPYARAFVVQFSADTDASLKHAAGRVEHLQTGTRHRFTSIASLRTLIAAMLASRGSGHPRPAAPRARTAPARPRLPGSGVGEPSP